MRIGRAVCGVVTQNDCIMRHAPYLGRWCKGQSWTAARKLLETQNAHIAKVNP